MKRLNWNTNKTIFFVLVVQMCLTVGIVLFLVYSYHQDNQSSSYSSQYSNSEKFTLYIGTNDKDTYTQLIPTEQAKAIVDDICTKYVDGYTTQIAQGAWCDEKGEFTNETTLIYSFTGVSEKEIALIMDEVLVSLNQNTILVERNNVTYSYYSK